MVKPQPMDLVLGHSDVTAGTCAPPSVRRECPDGSIVTRTVTTTRAGIPAALAVSANGHPFLGVFAPGLGFEVVTVPPREIAKDRRDRGDGPPERVSFTATIRSSSSRSAGRVLSCPGLSVQATS